MSTKKLIDYKCEIDWMGENIDTLQDIIKPDLNVLFIGCNPRVESIKKGHYHQGNLGIRFLKCIEQFRIIPEPTKENPFHDQHFLEHNIGITDIVKSNYDKCHQIPKAEFREGKKRLDSIIEKIQPKILFFVYKKAADELLNKGFNCKIGLNDRRYKNAEVFVFPSFRNSNDEDRNNHLNKLLEKFPELQIQDK